MLAGISYFEDLSLISHVSNLAFLSPRPEGRPALHVPGVSFLQQTTFK